VSLGIKAPLRWESVEMVWRPTTVGVDRFSSCAPLGGGGSYRVNGPAVVGVAPKIGNGMTPLRWGWIGSFSEAPRGGGETQPWANDWVVLK
jgi:hypothetical protein